MLRRESRPALPVADIGRANVVASAPVRPAVVVTCVVAVALMPSPQRARRPASCRSSLADAPAARMTNLAHASRARLPALIAPATPRAAGDGPWRSPRAGECVSSTERIARMWLRTVASASVRRVAMTLAGTPPALSPSTGSLTGREEDQGRPRWRGLTARHHHVQEHPPVTVVQPDRAHVDPPPALRRLHEQVLAPHRPVLASQACDRAPRMDTPGCHARRAPRAPPSNAVRPLPRGLAPPLPGSKTRWSGRRRRWKARCPIAASWRVARGSLDLTPSDGCRGRWSMAKPPVKKNQGGPGASVAASVPCPYRRAIEVRIPRRRSWSPGATRCRPRRAALLLRERLGDRDQAVEDRAVDRRAAGRRSEPRDRHDRRVEVAVAVEVEAAEDAVGHASRAGCAGSTARAVRARDRREHELGRLSALEHAELRLVALARLAGEPLAGGGDGVAERGTSVFAT